ncbi:MAG: adenylate kinase family protein [Candidatus Marsarchaeota archaeon]|nr:adenylate kinase family protein [Candidatus Marsarchaeota archaeon]
MKLVITGTPGTGKSSISRELSKITGWPLFELNKLAEPYDKDGSVDLKKLRIKTLEKIKGKRDFIVEGHLACEFRIPSDAVIVLRCKPEVLDKRLKKRDYSDIKVRENVLAEALDYCLIRSLENYDRVVQVDATKHVSTKFFFKRVENLKSDKIDWFKSLKRIALKTF